MSERTVCSNTHFERCDGINCPCYREGRESVTADQNQNEHDKLGANNNPLANERITRRADNVSSRRGDTSWTNGIPLVSEVIDDAGDGQPAIRVHDRDKSLKILNAALVLACRDGWADGESARRHYLGRGATLVEEEAEDEGRVSRDR